jgi:ribulose-5-phosphate 4-epimerase/fuculose-1-phosphate aldolase
MACIGKITGATTAEAFTAMHRLELSCRTQVSAMSGNTRPIIEVPADVVEASHVSYQPGTPAARPARPAGVAEEARQHRSGLP